MLSYDDSKPFRVSPEEKRLLLESIAQAGRGEFVDAYALLAELDKSSKRVRVVATEPPKNSEPLS